MSSSSPDQPTRKTSTERSFKVGKVPVLVSDAGSKLAVIVTHPWGLLGGNMHNNVVCAACLFFQKIGITTVRFDFDGSIGRGNAQVDQLLAVARNLKNGTFSSNRKETPSKILLIGYSYGSLISLSATADLADSCIACISVATPFSVAHWLLTFNVKHHMTRAARIRELPRLFIIGDQDNFTSESIFGEKVTMLFPQETSTGAVLKNADHFFRRREKDLLDIIGEWVLTTFPDCNGNLMNLKNVTFEAA